MVIGKKIKKRLILALSLIAYWHLGHSAECEIRGITFISDVKAFLSHLKPSQWKGEYSKTGDTILSACKADLSVNASGRKISPKFTFDGGYCPLRGEPNGPFGYLVLEWKNSKITTVKLSYHEGLRKVTEAQALEELVTKYGKPKKEIKYNEEAFTHTLRLWKNKECNIILNSGRLSQKPSEAVALYIFPIGYLPSSVDPMRGLFEQAVAD
ncbi:MAG: hypothetical protein AB7P04_12065 [Bacteriovoracia bacterium]